MKDTLFIIVQWPESQDFIGQPNCHLINDDEGVKLYGSSAYFVRLDMFEQITQETIKLS